MGSMGPGHIIHLAAASRLVGCVGCIRAQERAPAYRSSPGPTFFSTIHDPPCQLHPPQPHPGPPRSLLATLCPFSTPRWNLTDVKLRKTWSRIRSCLAFNPANPPRLSSPSFESESKSSLRLFLTANLNKFVTTRTRSRNGLPRL